MWIARSYPLDHFNAFIFAAVIDINKFVASVNLFHHCCQPPV